jgi:hypothetical protein
VSTLGLCPIFVVAYPGSIVANPDLIVISFESLDTHPNALVVLPEGMIAYVDTLVTCLNSLVRNHDAST